MRNNNIRIIALMVILGALINFGVYFFRSGEVQNSPVEVNVPQPEVLSTASYPEWTSIPVVSCAKNTRSDKKWIKSRYVLTLENGLVIGSENEVLAGDTTYCWINNFHKSKLNPKTDSLVFESPY